MKVSRIKEINYKEIILRTVFATTIISVAIMAPNALKMFDIFKKRNNWSKDKFEINSKTKKLITLGYLYWKKNDMGKSQLALTHKGLAELFRFKNVLINKKGKWDKKWRVVIFDIPSTKKKSREQLRIYLRQIGFVQLQKSVWIYPHNCIEIIKFIKNHFRFGREITYMIVDKIEQDGELKRRFKLK